MATQVLASKATRSRKEAFASRASRSFLESLRAAHKGKGQAKSGSSPASSPRNGKTVRAVAEEGDWTLVLKTDRARPTIEVRAPGSRVERTTADEAFFQLAAHVHLLRLAEDVLGNADDARRWFYEAPQPTLDGATAAEHAQAGAGVADVEAILHRIEHGVF